MASVAVLDTSLVLGLLFNSNPGDPRVVRGLDWVESLRRKSYRLTLPATVMAELSEYPRAQIETNLTSFRIEPFTRATGFEAARIHSAMLASRVKGQEKQRVKFDVLIMATAIEKEAAYLLTLNASDFKVYRAAAKASLKIVDAGREPLDFPFQPDPKEALSKLSER